MGSGKQKIAAVSNLICYYCIGLPVSIALMFKADLRVLGIPAERLSHRLWLHIALLVFIFIFESQSSSSCPTISIHNTVDILYKVGEFLFFFSFAIPPILCFYPQVCGSACLFVSFCKPASFSRSSSNSTGGRWLRRRVFHRLYGD